MAIVFQTRTMGDAHFCVALVHRSVADLLVHRVSRGYAYGDALWWMTHERGEASVRIFITSQGMARVKICFVDAMGEAGWQRPRPPGVHF